MHIVRNITEDIFYIGSSDRKITLFENIYPVPEGVSYNSYLLSDEKTVLLDTVDKSISKIFFENLKFVLAGKKLDYVVINHMEPDHTATLAELVEKYPEVTIIGNAKTFAMIGQFFDFTVTHKLEVKEGDTLHTGKHELKFIMAPMVHWPEVMFTYDSSAKILFSADAFGTFGALSGNIFADEINFDKYIVDEARRYYSNIVGKYGTQVLAVYKKLANLEMDIICPLHGPIYRDRESIAKILQKHSLWASYEPEDNEVVIFCGTVYGGTEEACQLLANALAKRKITNIKLYDTSAINPSYLLAEAFRAKVLVFASSSYNGGIFTSMEFLLSELKAHAMQNRDIALIENGSWALSAGKVMNEFFDSMKNMRQITDILSIKSSIKEEHIDAIENIADKIAETLNYILVE